VVARLVLRLLKPDPGVQQVLLAQLVPVDAVAQRLRGLVRAATAGEDRDKRDERATSEPHPSSFRRIAQRLVAMARGALPPGCQPADSHRCYVRALASGLDFRLLGPFEVWDGDRRLRLGGTKQRAVLAILALHRGDVVSSDRLADELWADRPPADAATALQQHVSRLRKGLEPHDVLVTRAPGYVLELRPEQLDLERFRSGHEEGRRLLAAGDAPGAASTLADALGLWRGLALADLAGEPFAAARVRELEEAHLQALELRVEADLALGRHGGLVGELRELVRVEPFRERPRAQLMLALYRSGRQAEALEAYAHARRTFVDELGLEPGPELQRLQGAILAQDPSLERSHDSVPVSTASPSRRSRALAALPAAALAAAAVLAGAWFLRDEPAQPVVASSATGAAVAVDSRSGEILRRIPAGRTPAAIGVRDGVVWLVDADARTLLRIDTASRVVESLATGATPTDLAVGDGSVWVANGRRLERSQFIGPVATSVARLDASTRTERAETQLPFGGSAVSNLVENHLAVSQGAVWAVTPDFAVARIDTTTGAVIATNRDVRAAAVAVGGAGVWALGVDGEVARLDERTARTVRRARVPVAVVSSIAVGDDAAWVTSPADGTLWRVGAGRAPSLGSVQLTPGITDVAADASGVWVVNPTAGTLIHVDPETATVERTIAFEGIPRAVALDGATAWVAVVPGPERGVTGEVDGVRAFASGTCETVQAGADGRADVLVTSDLPLQGGVRVTTGQMAQAIAFVLRERRFRAGRFRVAYQSCDDSVARTGLFDEAKCEANARAYAENPDVVGVIGTFNSPCALAALPTLNRAPGGPLAMVSPFNSFVGLTRPGPGIDPALPAALYPTGRRSYARVFPTDDLQGAALALDARARGERRVFVLSDGEPGYGVLMATGFETAARRLGLRVVGRATWDPQARSQRALAARVARARPEAVFVGGLLDTGAAAVIAAIREELGPEVSLLGPDGLTPLSLLVKQAGEAAVGVRVSLAGLVVERLPPAGAAFLRRFARTQPGAEVEPSAIYAAQATEVLLDAIARSDGTRPSVVRQLFLTRVRDGLLGSFSFDANGDISESPITILRVVRKGKSTKTLSVEGGVVERVVRPSSTLVASDP